MTIHFRAAGEEVLNIYDNGKLLVSIDRSLAPALILEAVKLLTKNEPEGS